MAKQSMQDLLDMITALQSKIEVLETAAATKKRGAKPEVVKAPKLYSKLNGHYFKLNTEIVPAEELEVIKNKIQMLLSDADYKSGIEKMQLGRCMLAKLESNEVYFWSPNQEKLMFGPIRAGMKNSSENQLFEIKLEYLIDLGNGVEEKTGRVNLENQLNFEEFKKFEVENEKIKKLQNKLNELNNK